MNRGLSFALALLLFAVPAAHGREWRRISGGQTLNGDLESYKPPTVTLLLDDGSSASFNESYLSEADQRYCRVAAKVLADTYRSVPFLVLENHEHGSLCQELPGRFAAFSNETFFFRGKTGAVNAIYHSTIYYAGTYTYNSSRGATTVRCFTQDLDSAVGFLDPRSAAAAAPPTRSGSTPAPPTSSSTPRTRTAPGSATNLPPKTKKSSGTGFAITNDGYLVTNCHVIKDAITIRVIAGGTYEARLVTKDQASDLAILKIEARTQPLRLALEAAARLGDSVTTGGFPNPDIQGTSMKLTRGVISGMKGIADDEVTYQIDATVQPGNSGGPLLGANGEVVGVVVARINDRFVAEATGSLPQNVNYAIKLSYLIPVIARAPILAAAIHEVPHPAAGANQGELLERSTFLIRCEDR